MKRVLALGFSLFLVVAPRRIVDPAERLAFENPEVGRFRPWTLPMARLEGLAFGWLLVRGADRPDVLRRALALLGLAMALAPRPALAFGLEVAYENPGDLEVKSWVAPATRLLGVVYVVIGLVAGRVDAPSDAGRGAERSADL